MIARLRPLLGAGTATVLALTLGAAAATANHTTTFTSGVVAGGQPRNITAGPDGNLWFTYGHASGRVARIATGGTVTDLASSVPNGTGPFDIATGPDGNVWFTQNSTGRIGRLSPTGVYTEFSAGLSSSGGPAGIAAGPDGNMWFTLKSGEGAIGRITPQGTVTRFTSGLGEYLQPNDITAGPDGNLWFTLRGNVLASPAIGRITPAGVITRFSGLPYGSAAEQITAGPDGNLWFTLQTGNQIGRITPTGTITRFGSGLPSGSAPAGITAGADGKLWFTLTGADRVGSITTAGAITLNSSLGSGAEPTGITSGPDGNVWFVTRGTPAKVGRIAIAPPTVGAGVGFSNGPGDHTLTFPVNTMGHSTTYTLRYGATTAYGAFASGTIPASASSVSIRLGGLTPGAVHNYQLTVSNDAGSATGDNGTFTAGVSDPGATDPGPVAVTPDTPRLGEAVVVAPVAGRVTVRPPGLTSDVDLSRLGGQLPVGTVVDTRGGRIKLTSALPGGAVQSGEFWGGRFTVTQSRRERGMTTLALPAAPLSGCPGGRVYTAPPVLTPMAGVAATEAAKKRRKAPPRRTLWGKDDKGKFRTQGHNSVATVRGTKWVTVETCAGTLTRVIEGAVVVRDLKAKRTVLVRAGRSHLARRPR